MNRILYTKVMTPVLSIFLGCFLFSAFACGEGDYTPKKYRGLKGKVVSIRDSVYDCTLQGSYQLPGEFTEAETVDFDAEGNVIRIARHNADSSFVTVSEFAYKDNVLVSSCGQSLMGGDAFTSTSERIGVENGILKFKEDNGSEQYIREVKTNGKYCMEYSKYTNGYSKEESWADNNDNIIKTRSLLVSSDMEFMNGTNTLEEISLMKYDKDGNLTEATHIKDKDTITTVCSHHRYDKYGNWTEERAETNGYFKRLIKRTIKYTD